MNLIREESILPSEWIDYIFSPGKQLAEKLLHTNIMRRRRGYLWYLQNKTNEWMECSLRWYRRIQNLKWFVWCIRMKRQHATTERDVETDLMGQSFETIPYVQLSQNGVSTKYSVDDLVGMIQLSLEQRQEFVISPRIPSDPYTNITLSLGALYKIQGWLRKSPICLHKVSAIVLQWIKTPYISQTLFTGNSEPYLLSEHLTLIARSSFFRQELEEGEDMSTVLTEIRKICETLHIPLSSIDWDYMLAMQRDRFTQLFQPILLYWLHPMTEWLEGGEMDDRMLNWKCVFVDYCKSAGCWLGVDVGTRRRGRLLKIRRHHRIGMR